MYVRNAFLLSVFCLVAALVAAPARGADDGLAAAIHALVADTAGTTAGVDADVLGRFYAARNDAPAWIDSPQREASLLAILAAAPQQGLSVPVPHWLRLEGGGAAAMAARDVALSRLALDYAAALAVGRVVPTTIETDWGMRTPRFDAAQGLNRALDHGLAHWYASLPPQHRYYQGLVGALARYRRIAADGGWGILPRGVPLKLGMIDPRVPALRRRLAIEGDLAPALANVAATASSVQQGAVQKVSDTVAPDMVYDAAVEAAVRQFQRRHGIAVDGTLGPRTLAALNVPAWARVRQIELNLERWRAMPHHLDGSYMMVNVPAERLDVVDRGNFVISMKVVVGEADHPTPILDTLISAVTLNPTWTIPLSIVNSDLKPKMARNPDYARRLDIVFTPGRGWQQLPGPRNPLGRIKFESSNRFDVYLHDTPSRYVFNHYFRAASHGCVRLERAQELAGFVLDDTAWSPPAIDDAIAAGQTQHIELRRDWRVWLVYATAFVDPDGTVEFRDDVYGRDARLAAALKALRTMPAPQRQARLGHL